MLNQPYESVLTDFLIKKQFLRDQELCELFGWTPETLRVKRSKGEAPVSKKIKNAFLTRYNEVEEFIKQDGVDINNRARAAANSHAKELSAQDILK